MAKGHCSLPQVLVKCSLNQTQLSEVSNSSWNCQTVLGNFQTVFASLKLFSEVLNSSAKFLDSSRKCQTVIESFGQFQEVSNSSRNFQTVVGSHKQFSEVLYTSRKSQTILGSLKQFSDGSNSSLKLQMVLESIKQFSGVSNSSRQSQTVLGALNSPRFLPIRFIILCFFRWLSLIVVKSASKVGSC